MAPGTTGDRLPFTLAITSSWLGVGVSMRDRLCELSIGRRLSAASCIDDFLRLWPGVKWTGVRLCVSGDKAACTACTTSGVNDRGPCTMTPPMGFTWQAAQWVREATYTQHELNLHTASPRRSYAKTEGAGTGQT